jgi:predicted NBD/HSP70 family sugar kinase
MIKPSVVNSAFLRERNLSTVLNFVFYHQSEASRAKLAEQVGLNKSTASSLVQELIERDLLRETGKNPAGAIGRPATFLEINFQAGFIIGVDLSVDFISVMVTDFGGQAIWKQKFIMDSKIVQADAIAKMIQLVKEAIAVCKQKNNRVLGLGLTVPGLVDTNGENLIYAPHLHWKDVPLRKILSESIGLNEIHIENDANAATIGEHIYGVACNTRDFIFVFIGKGIGSGLFLGGNLYRGINGYAGEIGHIPIIAEPYNNLCDCGNLGCWETYANESTILNRTKAILETRRSTIISDLMEEQQAPLSIAILKQAADAGDQGSLKIFAEAGEAIGIGIAGLINIFNPDKVIVGGPISISGNHLLPAIINSVKRHTMPGLNQHVEILLSEFGSDVVVIGAIACITNRILSTPTLVERRQSIGENN